VVARVFCLGKGHLNSLIQIVINDSGEGVILRQQGSLYEQGRTGSLIKLKVLPTATTMTTTVAMMTTTTTSFMTALAGPETKACV